MSTLVISQTKQYSAEYHYEHFKHFHQLRILDQLNSVYDFIFKYSHTFIKLLPSAMEIYDYFLYTFLSSELKQ